MLVQANPKVRQPIAQKTKKNPFAKTNDQAASTSNGQPFITNNAQPVVGMTIGPQMVRNS